jgi:GT2 family glycosyltransferase
MGLAHQMNIVMVMIGMTEQLAKPVATAIRALCVPLVQFVAPRVEGLHPEPDKNRCINIAIARNHARALALKKDASHYFWLDDDIVPPRHAISSLLSHNKPVMGGWFQMRNGNAWVGGRWVADNTFQHYVTPQRSVVKTDLISLGCALVRRDVLQAVEFGPGIDRYCQTMDGRVCHLADSGDFSNKLLDLGIQPYLDGNVICQHSHRIK